MDTIGKSISQHRGRFSAMTESVTTDQGTVLRSTIE